MADSNENLLNQKYLVQRCHRDQKFYRYNRIVPETSIIYKLVNTSDSCAHYYNGKVSRHQNNWVGVKYLEKNSLHRGKIMRKIDCAHSRSVKMLP